MRENEGFDGDAGCELRRLDGALLGLTVGLTLLALLTFLWSVDVTDLNGL